jgi:predicted dehydrogenase
LLWAGWISTAGRLAFTAGAEAAPVHEVRLITLDPGHFHAALLQKEMLPGLARRVHIYAPLGPDLLAHLDRIRQFNTRPVQPTSWELDIHTGPDFLDRLLAERPGNVVVLSGNNQHKVDRLLACLRAGFHVLADKPWIIQAEDLPQLQTALDTATQRGVVAFDAMTQRYEITCLLQKELVQDTGIFGVCLSGSEADPAVHMESVHYLRKEVAGVPLLRPPWFFDLRQQGECLADAGPHLVDLVQWTLFPGRTLDYRTDIEVRRASRKAILLTQAQFQSLTGQAGFPEFLQGALRGNRLEYFADNRVQYTVRGIHVQLDTRWEYEAPPGGKDTEFALFWGSRSRIEVRQSRQEQFIPEVYVVPNQAADRAAVRQTLEGRIQTWQDRFPGLEMREEAEQLHLVIPAALRVGHEAHFALLVRDFLASLHHPDSIPAYEGPNLLAKYFVTTQGVALARKSASTDSTP